MIIGVPKEVKNHEYRVGIVPAGVQELVHLGHKVVVEHNAGLAIGLTNTAYLEAGAEIVETASQVFDKAECIIKVKELQPFEYPLLQAKHILFTYLHLAADRPQVEALIKSGATCLAYETVTDDANALPLLAPMSEIAGRMAIQAGANALQKVNGGSGVLLSGVPGVQPGNVMIIGGGVVGSNAARVAAGMGANVYLFDKSLAVLRRLDHELPSKVNLIYATQHAIQQQLTTADLVIGAVLVPGDATPRVVTRSMLKHMQPGSVIVDVAIDQGGCFETSRPTSHDHPTYTEENIVHYCVSNMPGAVARTASLALCNATLPFIIQLAQLGKKGIYNDPHLRNGINIASGHITHPAVANAHHMNYVNP